MVTYRLSLLKSFQLTSNVRLGQLLEVVKGESASKSVNELSNSNPAVTAYV